MAKDKPKNDPGKQKGGKKSSRWSVKTQENKRRAAETHENRLKRAAERREKGMEWTDPATGKVKRSATVRDRRLVQSRRVATKRSQRQNFKALSTKDQQAHREVGRVHGTIA